jgi:hypothetical protein
MMKRSRLRARQEAMFKEHHSKPRPYDYARREREEDHRLRLKTMFNAGLSDEFISKAIGVSVQGVRFLRDVRHCKPQKKLR